MANGLFGGKPKGIDTQLLQDILTRGTQKQTGLVKSAFAQTPQLSRQFEARRGALGKAFETGSAQRAQQFAQGLQQIESPDFVRQQQARARELAFRDVPAAQQQIREQLAATGGLGRGVAIRALQQPTLQAAQASRDESFRIEQAARQRDINRQQSALSTIFQTGQGAALQRLGIDEATANVLLETGRSDILDRAFKLAGIEAGRTQGLLDIEQLRQTQEIAREQAKQAGKAQLLSTIGSLAGAGLGAFAGPAGPLIGSQLGGQLGGFAGGGQAPDLSSALTLLALRRRNSPQPNPELGPIGPPGSSFIGPSTRRRTLR
jgi:hypothetical protein